MFFRTLNLILIIQTFPLMVFASLGLFQWLILLERLYPMLLQNVVVLESKFNLVISVLIV